MEALWQDLRYAARMIRSKPAFAAVAILTLALGIGANTAIFSVVNAVLLRPLPYKDPERLVRIIQSRPNAAQGMPARMAAMSTDDLQAWRPRTRTLSHIAAYGREGLTLTGREEPLRLNGARVSPALFPMLRAQPLLGRVFEDIEEKPGSETVVILSYSAWQRYFNSDRDILGRNIMLEGRGYSVIGVMPETFEFPDRETSFWIPFVLTPAVRIPGQRMIQITQVVARVKDDVTMAQATAEANMIYRQLREEEAAVDAQAPPSDAPPSELERTQANSRPIIGPQSPIVTERPDQGEGQRRMMRGRPDGPVTEEPRQVLRGAEAPVVVQPGGPETAAAPSGRGLAERGGPAPPRGGIFGMGTNVSIELVSLKDEMVAPVRAALVVLLVSVGFVLLIACANVANLLLARAAGRQMEIAIRAALGAGRVRLLRQVLTESVLLALFGGVIGAALAFGGVRLLAALGPGNIPRLNEISIDVPVFAYSILISLVTGIAFGIVPAARLSRSERMQALKEGAMFAASGFDLFRGNRARSLLAVAEIALAMVLLIGAGLLINSFLKLSNVDPGYDPENVLTFQVALPQVRYPDAQRLQFYEQMLSRLQVLPGVKAAAMANTLPLNPGVMRLSLNILGRPEPTRPEELVIADMRVVSPQYVDAMGLKILDGRGFNDNDREGQRQVLMVNRTFARRYFANENPIGQRVRLGGPDPFAIVGLLDDVRHAGLDAEPQAEIYLDYRQARAAMPRGLGGMFFALRTSGDPSSMVSHVRTLVRQLDSQLTIDNVATMERRLSDSVAQPRFYAVVLGIFAAVAMILATVGIYGIMAYSVSQRTREIGIRMALGADRYEVLGLILRQGVSLTAIGVIAGLGAAFAVTRYLQKMLFGLGPSDPSTFVEVSLLLGAIAILACYLPARRATRVDPLLALRYE
jgi:predicted permease